MKAGCHPSKPMNFLLEDRSYAESTHNFFLEENHLEILFKVYSEVADIKFRIDQLDQKFFLSLALCSSPSKKHPDLDLTQFT